MKTHVPVLIFIAVACFIQAWITLENSISVAIAFNTMALIAGATAAGLHQVNKRLSRLESEGKKNAGENRPDNESV
jgi:hypothetical protein